ncbi:DUF429 domain-containing protein [uncultured Roseibium sp.]|uniref:DUF429 domain-containing protein n=1 Tax=uncultured Roseibium sp. TaxID=1936171 RepID=UPI003216640D
MPEQGANWVAGVDGCKAGWVAVIRRLGEAADARLMVFSSFSEVLDYFPAISIIAVDMPGDGHRRRLPAWRRSARRPRAGTSASASRRRAARARLPAS